MVNLQLIWKKDQKRVESKSDPQIGGKGSNSNLADFKGEVLSLISSVYKDKNAGNYIEKNSTVVIKIVKGDKTKSVGQVNLNLSKFIEN